jgi:hypothetical protein
VVGCGDGDPVVTPPPAPKLDSSSNILAFLEGKTMVMEGANIPSHPNGFSEDRNLGAATQCYHKVVMTVAGGNYRVVSDMGTLRSTSTPNVQDCDRTTKSGQTDFTSTGVLIENVAADGSCFDVTYTYPSFKQVGRGQVSQDGKTLKVELFFENQATGARCANGGVGAAGVIVGGEAIPTGSAVQTYAIQ